MQKEKYEIAELEIIRLQMADVILESDGNKDIDYEEDELPIMK